MDQTTKAVADNLTALMRLHDLSTRGLSARSNPTIPQKTIWTAKEGKNSAKLSTLDALCRTLFVSPAAMVTPNLPTELLMSRRLPRLIDSYARLSADDRDRLELYIGGLLSNLAETDNSLA